MSLGRMLKQRVEIPGVEREEVDALQEGFDRFARNRLGFLRGMAAKGAVPYMGTARPKRKKRSTTAHVRRMREHAARAATLAARRA